MKKALAITWLFILFSIPAFGQTRVAFDITSHAQEFTDGLMTAFIDLSEDYTGLVVSDVSRSAIVVKITALDLNGIIVLSVVATTKREDELVYILDTIRVETSAARAVSETLKWITSQGIAG